MGCGGGGVGVGQLGGGGGGGGGGSLTFRELSKLFSRNLKFVYC